MTKKTTTTRRSKPETNQAAQRRMVEQAMKIPGVAEAIKVYGSLQPEGVLQLRPVPNKVRHAAGGNG